jgi:hypothetical protein
VLAKRTTEVLQKTWKDRKRTAGKFEEMVICLDHETTPKI